MARPLRIEYPGAYYHITSRGNERKAIFNNKKDRESFISYLKSAHVRYGAVFHVYCLMNNHYHLLLETPQGNLAQIMRHINGAYTTYFNVKHKRAGHLFQGRYKSILVQADAYAGELSRYIHLNPVRAGITKKPEEYKWSSYHYYIGRKKNPDWLTTGFILNYFSGNSLPPQKEYMNFVLSKIYGNYESPLQQTIASTLLGNESFIERISEKYLKDKSIDRNVPALRELKKAISIDVIYNESKKVFGDDDSSARKGTIFYCHRYSGIPLKEIGIYFGICESAISLSSHRFNQVVNRDRKLRRKINLLIEQLRI